MSSEKWPWEVYSDETKHHDKYPKEYKEAVQFLIERGYNGAEELRRKVSKVTKEQQKTQLNVTLPNLYNC